VDLSCLGPLTAQQSALLDESAAWARKAADQGDASAQRQLGAMHSCGVAGVPRNLAQAAAWYHLAAAQGDGQACYAAGELCERGEGVPQSDQGAAQWYAAGAAKGHAECQYNYAVCVLHGRGLGAQGPQPALALPWYVKAARQGHASAAHSAGLLVEQGVPGTPADAAGAIQWFTMGAAKGHGERRLRTHLRTHARVASCKYPRFKSL
jgi:hypothetical protein